MSNEDMASRIQVYLKKIEKIRVKRMKREKFKHLLKTDVALCDFGTRLLGNTRCRAWPEKEPRECEVTTYILWLHSVPYESSPWRLI